MSEESGGEKAQNKTNKDSAEKKGQNKIEMNKLKGENQGSNSSDSTDSSSSNQGLEYTLFLILILLLLGNQKSFNEQFRFLNEQTQEIKKFLNAFEATAEGLKTTIMTPQQIFEND